ncbi:hypothetical protein [Leptolyngbya sp. O-77]|uniref:hypothetical protein n=1 Tax=Leptolyngbya sp. O-77 TaxID=1080068 RepID=UPI00074D4C83|nr:hypothetical protein [Leptolyngbya sp. O-77]BAU42709.1 hypothetical protein O77CONTIG1_02531 [Leptolyngbya sp. O-77]
MLHADRFEGTLPRHLYVVSGSDVSSKTETQLQECSSAAALQELLAKEVSPSKRAVIETLIKLWEANPRVYLQQTG